jgi:uncharacterized protein YpmB
MVKNILIACVAIIFVVLVYSFIAEYNHEADHARTSEQLQEECDNAVDDEGTDLYSAEECEVMVADYEAKHGEAH